MQCQKFVFTVLSLDISHPLSYLQGPAPQETIGMSWSAQLMGSTGIITDGNQTLAV